MKSYWEVLELGCPNRVGNHVTLWHWNINSMSLLLLLLLLLV